MAEQKPAATPPAEAAAAPRGRKAEKTYYIVNPKGAIHAATREHARTRLGHVGWRMATKEEVAELEARGGHQVADSPICKPWSPDPAAQLGEEL